jgi:hypothetical protein
MKRIVAALAAVAVVAVMFGARPANQATADPVHVAALQRLAGDQADRADIALRDVEDLVNAGVREASRGQSAVLGGTDDPSAAMEQAAVSVEAAAAEMATAHAALAELAWTLRALAPESPPPSLTTGSADLLDLAARWRATGLPLAAEADLRRSAESTLSALGSALAALDRDDPNAALAALADAEASLDVVRESGGEVPGGTLPFWISTVEALLAAATDIANAALDGDTAALDAARAAYELAAADASRADQALAIALGEAAVGITAPPSETSAEILREVAAARAALAALSILP